MPKLKEYDKQSYQKENVSYNIYGFNNGLEKLVFTLDNRPTKGKTIESVLEEQLAKRMKKFIPTDFDLVDYDKELLKKQLDIQSIKVTLIKDDEKAKEYDMPNYYEREVRKVQNEEGMFARL